MGGPRLTLPRMKRTCAHWIRTLALSWLALSAVAIAQTKPTRTEVGGVTPASILWVGNSFFYYNNSLHNHVSSLIRAADPKYRFRSTSVTISGSGSDWHDVGSYFRGALVQVHRQVDCLKQIKTKSLLFIVEVVEKVKPLHRFV